MGSELDCTPRKGMGGGGANEILSEFFSLLSKRLEQASFLFRNGPVEKLLGGGGGGGRSTKNKFMLGEIK